jgi:trk system potassium uptake protein TrkH
MPRLKQQPISKWDVRRSRLRSLTQRVTPPQLFVASFVFLIAFGTIGLKTLPGLYTGEPLSWLDALFTTTSAVCVTGLTVVDTATYFTFAGQAFILLLIQLGGLGMLAFASLIIIAFGRRMSLREEALSTGSPDVAPELQPRQLAIDVVRFTFTIEATGALALYVMWIPQFGFAGALWPAIFHAVSAFCNAGFSTFPNNLVSIQTSPGPLLVIMALIVMGGLGFLTMEEFVLRYRAEKRKQIFRLSLHSQLVVVTTALLIVAGTLFAAIFEWDATLANLSPIHKLTNAMFISVTARTAGFNSIDYAQATDSTNFLSILLMMIGGSPGSTAGGIKTTTFALIGLVAWSRLMGHRYTTFSNRSVREETSDRAVGLFVIAFGIVTLAVFCLTLSEDRGGGESRFLAYMFEAVSAFGTVGLSMNLSPELTAWGKLTDILLMFLGRVGPLTLAAAFARAPGDKSFRYAYEEVVIG